MRRITFIISFWVAATCCFSQRILSLEECREMALNNNKQISAAKVSQEAAYNGRKAARTKYLPRVDAVAGYQYFTREVSILNKNQKNALSNMGTNISSALGERASGIISGLVEQGAMSAQEAQQLSGLLSKYGEAISEAGNKVGSNIRDAFRTNTHHIWAGAVTVSQPIYMGGAITAANRIADLTEEMSAMTVDDRIHNALYDVDKAYWLVVSLKNKKRLAESYLELVKKFSSDIHKMIDEGVGTRAEGLRTDVRVNEAEMAILKVDDGLLLAKMLLCQLCGMPMDEEILLADEDKEGLDIPLTSQETMSIENALDNRTELHILSNAIDITKENSRLIKAMYRPQVLLTGSYLLSNPNGFNGFERKFGGVFNIGVSVHMPIWNWGEGKYKVRAAQAATNIAEMEMSEVREKMELQIRQNRFRVTEARRRLEIARNNIRSAEENLRCADVGYREGVMTMTEVLAAQTAWQQAKSDMIDAEIDVRLSQIDLNKSVGR
ncbi:MAG: TolC family protein [Prevotella sp.]|nr:TolC family protein [Prevotella sp.]MCR5152781.1 TolC family protein [Prevotella sp.]